MKSQIKVIIFELLVFCISLDLGPEDYVYIHITYMSVCIYMCVYIYVFKLRQLLAKYPLYS